MKSGPDAAGPVDAGGIIAVDAGAACNALAPSAPLVPYALSNTGSPATAAGGPIADGTYYLTAYTIFGAGSVESGFTANQSTAITLQIAGSAWTEVQVYAIENTTSTVSANLTATMTGTSISLASSCPGGVATAGTYTATDSAIQLVTQSSGFLLSETFAKQ